MYSSAILLFVTALCGIIYSTHAVTCDCDQSLELGPPAPECLLNFHKCNSSIGCYARRFYNSHADRIVERRDCLVELDSGIFNYTKIVCERSKSDDITKCCFTDFCNGDIRIVLPIERDLVPTPSTSSKQAQSSGQVDVVLVSLATSIPIMFLLLLFIIFICIILFLYRNKHFQQRTQSSSIATQNLKEDLEMAVSCETTGTDLPYIVVQDIKDIVKMNYQLSIGKFGTFYHGYYDREEVALKKFEPHNKTAWLQESIMYNKLLQSHDNILVCHESAMIVSDIGCELWLVTQYHKFGSLQDYLRQHTVTPQVLIQMIASMCGGLAYLHSDGSFHQTKLPVAHCNLTSKNILIKNNLSCCIGDFRLAVFKHKNEVKMSSDIQLGTVRYMAPEVLDKSINLLLFESFKHVDIYALGLVMWEISNRMIRNGELAEPYQIPFQDIAFPEATIEDMKTIVVTKKILPTIPNKWNNDKLLCGITKVMQECWYYNSSGRPTAVYLKKKLLKMAQNYDSTMPRKEEIDVV